MAKRNRRANPKKKEAPRGMASAAAMKAKAGSGTCVHTRSSDIAFGRIRPGPIVDGHATIEVVPPPRSNEEQKSKA